MFFVKSLSLLPLGFLYFLAELTAILAFHVFHYRRGVVRRNLAAAFPEKSKLERIGIARNFYRQFFQVFAEFMKAWRFTKEDWLERFPITNPEVVEEYLKKGVPIVLMSGHTANWEWGGYSISAHFNYDLDFLYKPVKKKAFDDIMLKLRTRHGGRAISKDNAIREVLKRRKKPRFVGFIGDQLPSMGTEKYWLNFLNRPTAFYVGAERIATLTQYAAFYADVHRTGRGRYELTFKKLGEPPYEKGEQGIIANFVEMLEDTIHRHPSDYLWSHKRWKYTKEEEEAHLASLKD